MVVCAGSPRAASTAECLIAQDVIDLILEAQHKRGLTNETRSIQAGYFNYHLHTFCDDTDCGKTYPEGPIENAEEWRAAAGHIPDKAKRKEVYHSIDTLQAFNKAVAKATKHSAVIVKSHEFDADLMEVCDKRMILTPSPRRTRCAGCRRRAARGSRARSPRALDVFNKYFDIWKDDRRVDGRRRADRRHRAAPPALRQARERQNGSRGSRPSSPSSWRAPGGRARSGSRDIQGHRRRPTAEDFEQDAATRISRRTRSSRG